MHHSEFQPKHDFLISIQEDAHNASMICITSRHLGHGTLANCPHEKVWREAVNELETLWEEYLTTPVEERYS